MERTDLSGGWNNRIVKYEYGYAVTEVYYDKDKNPVGWIDPHDFNPTFFEEREFLNGVADMVARAFQKPVLQIVSRDGEEVLEELE